MVRRDLSRKKKPKIVLPRRSFRRVSELHDEPEWTDPVERPDDVRLARALSYYNYVDLKDKRTLMRQWVQDYMESTDFTSQEKSLIKKVEDWRISNSVAAVSRMIEKGMVLAPELKKNHDDRVRDVLTAYARHQVAKEEKACRKGPVVDKFKERVRHLIASVEEAVDRVDSEFSTYDFLTESEASSLHAKAIADHYRPVLEEIQSIKKDRVLKEAYSNLSRAEINSLVSLYQTIVQDAERFASNKRASAPKKPRKRKEKSAAQLTKDVKYLKDFPELKLVSIDPAQIVGAGTVWLYNAKYKQLRRLVAAEGETLTVSGSTVKGFDEKLSEQKALRKPENVLPQVLDGTTMSLRRVLEKLTTKSVVPNGRINPDTLILRTTK